MKAYKLKNKIKKTRNNNSNAGEERATPKRTVKTK
jgi:hypothetical protein